MHAEYTQHGWLRTVHENVTFCAWFKPSRFFRTKTSLQIQFPLDSTSSEEPNFASPECIIPLPLVQLYCSYPLLPLMHSNHNREGGHNECAPFMIPPDVSTFFQQKMAGAGSAGAKCKIRKHVTLGKIHV